MKLVNSDSTLRDVVEAVRELQQAMDRMPQIDMVRFDDIYRADPGLSIGTFVSRPHAIILHTWRIRSDTLGYAIIREWEAEFTPSTGMTTVKLGTVQNMVEGALYRIYATVIGEGRN